MIRRALDFIYPPLCELCGELQREGRNLCDTCSDLLPRINAPFCQKCGEAFEGQIEEEFSCPNCTNINLAFDFARSPLATSAEARQLIHALKYQRKFQLSDDLAPFFSGAFPN